MFAKLFFTNNFQVERNLQCSTGRIYFIKVLMHMALVRSDDPVRSFVAIHEGFLMERKKKSSCI